MAQIPVRPRCREYGDGGLLVEFDVDPAAEEGAAREARWSASRALGEELRRTAVAGVVDVVSAFETVFIELDPLVIDHPTARALVARLAGAPPDREPGREHVLPVVYGGDHGPDLPEVARLLDLAPDDVVTWHAATPWTIRFVGSPAGAPLLEGPPVRVGLPRRSSPRARVQPGSVGLSGSQCIVYNAPSPGGWQLIGRTPLRLFDVRRDPPVGYRAGDLIRFRPVDVAAWADLAGTALDPVEP